MKNRRRNSLKNKTSKYIYTFQQLQTIKPFGDDIYSGKLTIGEAHKSKAIFNVFNMEVISLETTQGKGLKSLNLKQMLQRLPIAGNTFENLLKEIFQIIFSLVWAK